MYVFNIYMFSIDMITFLHFLLFYSYDSESKL